MTIKTLVEFAQAVQDGNEFEIRKQSPYWHKYSIDVLVLIRLKTDIENGNIRIKQPQKIDLLRTADDRIAELEGFNFGLATESQEQQERIAELEEELAGTAMLYGRNLIELIDESEDCKKLESQLSAIRSAYSNCGDAGHWDGGDNFCIPDEYSLALDKAIKGSD